MLTELVIRDFALIAELHLELPQGLVVLTGETGAGKSIILDALGLATGARADTAMVRHGAEKAEVSARFDIGKVPAAHKWLKESDIDDDGEVLIRRVVTSEGRSRAYVNGTPCPIGRLAELGSSLLEIHGQHEHYRLADEEIQKNLLDAWGKISVQEVVNAHAAWREARQDLESLRSDGVLSEAEADLIRYQVEELTAIDDDARNIEQLHEQHKVQAAAQELASVCESAAETLEESAPELLSDLDNKLQRAARIDSRLTEVQEMIQTALLHIQESATAMNRYRSDLELDAQSVDDLERRLEAVHDQARKHRLEPDQLPGRLAELSARLDRADRAEGEEARLADRLERAQETYASASAQLSDRRSAAARTFEKAVRGNLMGLGMDQSRFEVQIVHDAGMPFSESGQDRVEFRFSANAGQPPRSMSRVASGGELSRIGLALRVALSDQARTPTMIFDEVDAGVGGAVAQLVGEKLRTVARQCQVFSVTHLPQVAACGHHHLRVSKRVVDGNTQTDVLRLNDQQRVEEIARMVGGKQITDQSRSHAAELIRSGQQA